MPMLTEAAMDGIGDDRTEHSGRRSLIAYVLRDSSQPMSVEDVANEVGIHVNTARFHLEALVDAGLAMRETEALGKPGRRRVLYTGVQPNHEPVESYRLLASMLAAAVVRRCPDPGANMYEVGREWGRFLTPPPVPFEVFDEEDADTRVLSDLDPLWFAAEYCPSPQAKLLIHNCPFYAAAHQAPQVVCQMHAGMIDGSLEVLRSSRRVAEMAPQAEPHLCWALLGPASDSPAEEVPLRASEDDSFGRDI